MTKQQAKRLYRNIRQALTGLDGDFIRRILDSLPHTEIKSATEDDDRIIWKVEYGDLKFEMRFRDSNWSSWGSSWASYIAYFKENGIAKEFFCPPTYRGFNTEKQYGSGKYRYSLQEISSAYSCEPFYLNHLKAKDLKRYAGLVRSEMEEWDGWLKDGSISEDKRNDHLSIIEERIFHEFAPYEDELKSLDDILKLFL